MIANPYGLTSLYGHIFEILKDQMWRDEFWIQQRLKERGFAGWESFSFGALGRMRNEGMVPKPPKYPMGWWRINKRRGTIQLAFQDPVESAIDEKVVAKLIDEKVKDQIDTMVTAALDVQSKAHKAMIDKQIEELKKSSVPILELVKYESDKKITTDKIAPAHLMMPYLLYLMQLGEHVYLHDGPNGGPGSGKTTAALIAGRALGKRVGYISLTPTTFESRLYGYMDGRGKYVTTDFRECYEKGGRFIVDEGDNGSGNLYTSLNGALENSICGFPDKQVKRHPDFSVVMTGNTSGGGPNPQFPTRRPFDKAFAERFTFIPWDYDEQLERAIALSINKPVAPIWHDYILKLRGYCRIHFPLISVSPRATFRGCKFMRDTVMPLNLILHGVIFKGYDPVSVKSIMNAIKLPEEQLKVAVAEGLKGKGRKSNKGVKTVNG